MSVNHSDYPDDSDEPQDLPSDPEITGRFEIPADQIERSMKRTIESQILSGRWIDITFPIVCEGMGVKKGDPDYQQYAMAFHSLIMSGFLKHKPNKPGEAVYAISPEAWDELES